MPENYLCLMAIGELCVLHPRLYMLTNKDIVVGNWFWRYKCCLIANHKRDFFGKIGFD